MAVSTHSRPKAAGLVVGASVLSALFQHTAARRRLAENIAKQVDTCTFQHTAARRRLVQTFQTSSVQ
ncbi:hypothetical protein [Neisseria sicca]|uniref:hypothetical protein n=1 Tax=Neisseria sicca TaxID=490 RepID=UPI0039656D0A